MSAATPPTQLDLDLVFGALADATRRAILARLRGGEVSVTELTAGFSISQPAISKHLRVLERAGLISRSRRGAMRLSRLEAAPLQGADDWLADYRAFWEESYARLDDLLAADDEPHDEPPGRGSTDSHQRPSPIDPTPPPGDQP